MEELLLAKPDAEIREIKIEQNNTNILRIYRTFSHAKEDQCTFCFQIRTYKPINEFGDGKRRNMIANISLTIKEVKNILAYMKSKD